MSMQGKPSRRDFLGTSAATTAALAAGVRLSRRVHAAGTERFNVALIGAGGRGTGAAADCLRVAQHIKLVAVADAFEDRAQISRMALEENFGDQVDVPDERLFVGLDAYKKAIACDVDMIVHGTPPGFRPLHYRAATEAGKHVFMEKPCCVDAGGFRSLMETNKLADQKNLKVGVGLFRRHMPAYLDAMRKLYDGQLGTIQFMRCYCNMVAWGGGGWALRAPNRDTMSELEYQVRNWRVFDWLGATSSFTAVLGREASYSGRVVKWDELAQKGPVVFPENLDWDTEPPVKPDEHRNYEHLVPLPGIYKPF